MNSKKSFEDECFYIKLIISQFILFFYWNLLPWPGPSHFPPLGHGAAGGAGGPEGGEGGEGAEGGDGGGAGAAGGAGGAAGLGGEGAGRFSLTRIDFGFSCLWFASVLNTFSVIAAKSVVF